MKILVTGASSQPGYKLLIKLLERQYEVIGIHYSNPIPLKHRLLRKIRLDITNDVKFQDLIIKERPDVIYHLAAYGDVDGCERNKEKAWKTNVLATRSLATMAELVNAFFVYLSTDYVFDGNRGFYSEYDTPYPVNYYGLTKLMGEVAVMSRCSRYAIVRTSSIYGLGPGRKNFAKFLIEKLGNNETVKALIDQYTSPTHGTLLAEALLDIGENFKNGVFHVAGMRMSRYEFAVKVAETLGFDKSLIKEASINDFNWYAKRPRDSSLKFEETKKKVSSDFYSTERAMSILREEYERLVGV